MIMKILAIFFLSGGTISAALARVPWPLVVGASVALAITRPERRKTWQEAGFLKED